MNSKNEKKKSNIKSVSSLYIIIEVNKRTNRHDVHLNAC